jgi:septal ring factor EnvC (AmiA/AmiB activator)
MTRTSKLMSVAFVVMLGLWGCAQGPTGAAMAERLKALEAKNARLEEDFRAAANTRDQLRQQLTRAEEHVQKLQAVVRERDDLKVTLVTRTGERDQVSQQFEGFRKSLRDMLTQTEASVLRFPDGAPATITVSRTQEKS